MLGFKAIRLDDGRSARIWHDNAHRATSILDKKGRKNAESFTLQFENENLLERCAPICASHFSYFCSSSAAPEFREHIFACSSTDMCFVWNCSRSWWPYLEALERMRLEAVDDDSTNL